MAASADKQDTLLQKRQEYIARYSAPVVGLPESMLEDLHAGRLAYGDPAALAGFMDGDGSIIVMDRYIKVEIDQCHPAVPVGLHRRYGGVLSRLEYARPQNRLTLFGTHARQLLEDISPHVIIEQAKVELALRYFDACDRADEAARDALLQDIAQKSKASSLGSFERLCPAYIAGLFDAEGEVRLRMHHDGVNVSYGVNITQKLDVDLLKAIQRYLGTGSVNSVRFCVWNRRDVLTFVKSVAEHAIGKKKQLEVLQGVLTAEQRPNDEQLEQAIRRVSDEKHTIYDIGAQQLEQLNVAAKRGRVARPLTEAQQAAQLRRNREKAERMTGAGNPNYGVERSRQHSDRIGKGVSRARARNRLYTDQQILAIREAHANRVPKPTFDALATEFGVSRQLASDIAKGKVLTAAELQDDAALERVRQLKQERNGRFKLTAEQRQEIRDHLQANPRTTPTQVLRRFHQAMPALTIDVVKTCVREVAKLGAARVDAED